MLFAFLDELGHSGHYASRFDRKHAGSPLFGFAGFMIDDQRLRPFASAVINLKATYFRTSREGAIRREVKAVELFEPKLFTAAKPAYARGPIIQLALASIDLLKKSGGRICYFGLEKQEVLPPSHGHSHSDSILQRTCLRRVVEPIKREVQRQNVPCIIVVDHHSSHHKHADIIAYSMAADGYFEQLREPPMMAHSRLSTAIQVADWIAGLLNKVFISDTKKAFEWQDVAPYSPKFRKILTDGALPGSRVDLRP